MQAQVVGSIVTAGCALVGSLAGSVLSPFWRDRVARRHALADRRLSDRKASYQAMHEQLRQAVNALAQGSAPEDLDDVLQDAVGAFHLVASPNVYEKAYAVYRTIAEDDGLYVSRAGLDGATAGSGADHDELSEARGYFASALRASNLALGELTTTIKAELGTDR